MWRILPRNFPPGCGGCHSDELPVGLSVAFPAVRIRMIQAFSGAQMFKKILVGAAVVVLAGCAQSKGVVNPNGTAAQDVEIGSRGPVSGVGIESRDIAAMSNQMMRDMMANPILAGSSTPPRVIIDAEYFKNNSTQPINKNLITNRLRNELNRAANGRMRFAGRSTIGAVEAERELKRQGVTDVGSRGLTKATGGVDFRLVGEIATMDSRNAKTGMMQRYNQIMFEMQDMENGDLVWSGMYEFERSAADDVIYR